MKFFFILFFLSSNLFSNLSIQELDFIRKISDEGSESIILNGTKFCNEYFKKNNATRLKVSLNNLYSCKYSSKRDRFYIYLVAVEKRGKSISIKSFCKELISSRPEISDHMDKKLQFQKKEYLNGFFVDNFFNKKILNFSNNFSQDQRTISNEINEIILNKRFEFTNNNSENNRIIQKEINKINKIYKKIINNSYTNLDKIIQNRLNEIVRYKIFVNDVNKFISYSCNWVPGKGIDPYVKREKFLEFENI